MATRPPRTGSSSSGVSGSGSSGSGTKAGGFSLSRRLSERSRAMRPQPDSPSGGIGGVVGALHGLMDQLRSVASQMPPEQEDLGAAHSSGGLHADIGGAAAVPQPAHGFVRSVTLGGRGARMVFGYTVRMGLDGVTAEPFGDLADSESDSGSGPGLGAGRDAVAQAAAARQPPERQAPVRPSPARPSPVRQPIVELFEEAATIVVVAELPGADPAGLTCRVEGDALLIETDGARRYRKRVALPAAVAPGTLRHSFLNGILEVRLNRADAP